ncbi:MAG: methyltransferase domain-containing protein [Candidatus Eisenbacteria bacterium]|nr:methyltransferase domain-containing protein [Candidatus Eisenbacteria bacterium]
METVTTWKETRQQSRATATAGLLSFTRCAARSSALRRQGGGEPREEAILITEGEKQRFIRRSRKYRDLGFDRHAAAEWVARFAPTAAHPVLDVGTGKGLLAIALARRFADVVSVDVSRVDAMLADHLAEEAGVRRRINYLTLDASRLPFREGHFGAVAMMDVLHELEDAEPVLEESRRVARPAGAIILADFTAEGLELIARVHREDDCVHFVGPATIEWAVDWLLKRGFRSEEVRDAHLHRIVVLSKRHSTHAAKRPARA